MLWLALLAESGAAPSAALCERWRTSLASQATTLAATEHAFESANVNVQKARVRFDDLTASVRDGVCRIRAAGRVDLRGQVQVALYGMQTACRVQLASAPVVTQLEVRGSEAEPHIQRSRADLEGLKSKMSLCVDFDVVKGLVVDIADDWVQKQLPEWHSAIEQSLAR
ncbi:MAG: hypothetical protein AAF602_07725 [Myxococcota bacterium]